MYFLKYGLNERKIKMDNVKTQAHEFYTGLGYPDFM